MKPLSFSILFSLVSALALASCKTLDHDRSPSQAPTRVNMKNVTTALRITPGFKSNQTVVADLNEDGYADLVLTEWHVDPVQTKIFMNQAGQFFQEIPTAGFTARGSAVLKMAKGLFTPGMWGVVVRYPNAPLETYNLRVTGSIITFEKLSRLPVVTSNWGDVQIFDHDQDGKLDILATS